MRVEVGARALRFDQRTNFSPLYSSSCNKHTVWKSVANALRGTRIHVWIPSVSVLFVVALCLCTLVASMRDDSIGLLFMPIACALVCAGCRGMARSGSHSYSNRDIGQRGCSRCPPAMQADLSVWGGHSAIQASQTTIRALRFDQD